MNTLDQAALVSLKQRLIGCLDDCNSLQVREQPITIQGKVERLRNHVLRAQDLLGKLEGACSK